MNQQELSPQQALEILAQAAALYKGTLEEHNQLQNAVTSVRTALTHFESLQKSQGTEVENEPKTVEQ